jgi:hypothetical protein
MPGGGQAGAQGARGAGAPQFRPNPGLAYCIGYMNALLKAAQSNKGKA